MRPKSIVFDLFGDYIRYRGGSARMRTLSRLMGSFGVGDSTVRVVMARLRREGWFDSWREGRETLYGLNDKSLHMLDEGRSRIFDQVHDEWDRNWYMVIYSVPESDRAVREWVRKELAWLGFGPLAPSTYICPHDRLHQVRESLGDEPSLRLDTMVCQSGSLSVDCEMAARCWDLVELNEDYRALLRSYRKRMSAYRAGRLTPEDALIERTQLIYDYRKFPFRDPGLPLELLPAGWLGREAHELFLEAHELLRTPAEKFYDEVVGASTPST